MIVFHVMFSWLHCVLMLFRGYSMVTYPGLYSYRISYRILYRISYTYRTHMILECQIGVSHIVTVLFSLEDTTRANWLRMMLIQRTAQGRRTVSEYSTISNWYLFYVKGARYVQCSVLPSKWIFNILESYIMIITIAEHVMYCTAVLHYRCYHLSFLFQIIAMTGATRSAV
jgi:hypothetical protein